MNTFRYAMLILEISGFLNKYHPDEKTEISYQDRRMLERGIEFLKRVLSGHDLITSRNSLVPDLSTLNAYTFASQALYFAKQDLIAEQAKDSRKLFEKAQQLLEDISSGKATELTPLEVDDVRRLFNLLSRYAFNQMMDEEKEPAWDLLSTHTATQVFI